MTTWPNNKILFFSFLCVRSIKFSVWEKVGRKKGPNVEKGDDPTGDNFDIEGNVQIDDFEEFFGGVDARSPPAIH